MKKIVVVGGGISGLSSAYYIENMIREGGFGCEITLLECEKRTGGKIWSESSGGFLIEKGPNGFLDSKPSTLELCRLLGIHDKLLKSSDAARKRFIYSEGVLHRLPESPGDFLKSRLLSTRGKLRIFLEPFAKKPPRDTDETVADFVKRRIGKEALEKLVGPMVSGVFAGDPEKMSLKSSFPVMKGLEDTYGGLFSAMFKIQLEKFKERRKGKGDGGGRRTASASGPGGVLTSFEEGIEFLVRILRNRLSSIVQTGRQVTAIEMDKEGEKYRLHVKNGGTINADIVVFAVPAYAILEIFKHFDAAIADAAGGIPYCPVSVVAFGYEKQCLQDSLDGFGFLIPFSEGCTILGNLWDSSIFPRRAPRGHVLLRTMAGGAKVPSYALVDDNELIGNVKKELRKTLGISEQPSFVKIYRYPCAIPQYVTGHSKKLDIIASRIGKYPGIFVTGNAFRGVGINDCTHNGKVISDYVRDYLSGERGAPGI